MSSSAPASGQVSYSAPGELTPLSRPPSITRATEESIARASGDSSFFITKDLQKGSVTGVLVRGGFGWIRRGRLQSGLSVAIKILQPRDLKVQSVEKSKVKAFASLKWHKLA